MKKYLLTTPLIIIFFWAQNTTKPIIYRSADDNLWSGKISFSQIIYDTVHGIHYCGWENDTSWSEWRMEASINNNKGIAKSSFNGWKHGNGYDSCMLAW